MNAGQHTDPRSIQSKLPRWRGFNLLEKFLASREGNTAEATTDGNYGRLEPYREDDFRWIADWGFDFVRLPLSYLCWSGPGRYREMDEDWHGHRLDRKLLELLKEY